MNRTLRLPQGTAGAATRLKEPLFTDCGLSELVLSAAARLKAQRWSLKARRRWRRGLKDEGGLIMLNRRDCIPTPVPPGGISAA